MVESRAIYFDGPLGETIRYGEIPEEHLPEFKKRRQELFEYLSNVDEFMGEMFLEDARYPTEAELKAAIRRTCLAKTFTPVFVGSALKNKGVQKLLDGVLDYLPDPSEVANFALDESKEVPVKVQTNPERSGKHKALCLAFKLEVWVFDRF